MVAITLEMLVARLRQDPLAALDMTRVACEHLAEAYDRLRSLSADPTMYRLARTLMDLAADLGESTLDGMLVLRYIRRGPITVDPDALSAFLESVGHE